MNIEFGRIGQLNAAKALIEEVEGKAQPEVIDPRSAADQAAARASGARFCQLVFVPKPFRDRQGELAPHSGELLTLPNGAAVPPGGQLYGEMKDGEPFGDATIRDSVSGIDQGFVHRCGPQPGKLTTIMGGFTACLEDVQTVTGADELKLDSEMLDALCGIA